MAATRLEVYFRLMSVASLFLLMAQSTTIPPEPQTAEQCKSADGEIVVCGSRKANERYRLRPIHNAPTETGPPKAEIELAEGSTLAAAVESSPNPSVGSTPRFMVRFKLKF